MRFFMLRGAALLTVACVLPVLSFGQTSSTLAHRSSSKTAKATAAKLTNADVIGLSGAGLDDGVILAKIKAAPATDFDTSVDGLKTLKAGGVSSTVIKYMIDPSAPMTAPVTAAPVAVAAPAAVANNPDSPETVHSPGIYIQATGKDGKVHLTKLDHINPKQTKTSGAFLSGMTYGITKAHVKVAIDGAKANVETTDTNPVFYAYIPEESGFNGAAQNIRDFDLVKLDPKATTREVNTATISPWGASSGTDEKAKQGFTPETVKPGIYKMTLLQPLPAGQYAFQTQNYGAFFDFGVIAAQ